MFNENITLFILNFFLTLVNFQVDGRLAQLVRASALQAEGHWFESNNAHHQCN
jgi:hypothetical protein